MGLVMESVSVHLTLTARLRARAKEAAQVEGLAWPEYFRRAIVSACERTEAAEARRQRTKGGRK